MQVKDIDLMPVQILMDRINDSGCNYAHLDITSGRGEITFNMYTPQTNHNRFTDVAKLIEHMELIASGGESSVAVALAKEKIASAKQAIIEANEDIERAESVLKSAADADGVPL